MIQLLDDFSMVSFVPLDITDEESVEELLLQVDMAIQARGLQQLCVHSAARWVLVCSRSATPLAPVPAVWRRPRTQAT